jgi:hypothetical protein
MKYPMDKDTQLKLVTIMREILWKAAEFIQVILEPKEGEQELYDCALRLLANNGIVGFRWDPVDPKDEKTVLPGKVFVFLSIALSTAVLVNDRVGK